MAARVVPQVGQGTPVHALKVQGRRWGAIAIQSGRRAKEDAAATNHRVAN